MGRPRATGRWAFGLPGLLAIGRAEAASPDAIEVTADRIRYAAAVVEGEGGVLLETPEGTGQAERFRFDRETGVLVLERGTWTTGAGTLEFDTAELSSGGQTVLVAVGRLHTPELWLTGDTLRAEGSQRFTLEGARFSTCTCEAPPWELEAQSLEVVLDEEVVLNRGWLRLCALRVVPLPRARLPLKDRHTGLLAPRPGWDQDGLRWAQPVMLTMGPHADLALSPELRQRRGARVLAESRVALSPAERLDVGGALGWDWQRTEVRGLGLARGAWTPGPWRMGGALQATTDADYLSDYGEDFIARSAPWSEVVGHVGLSGAWLETRRYQRETPTDQGLGALVMRRTMAVPGAGLPGTVEARADLVGVDASGLTGGEDRALRATVAGESGRGLALGPADGSLWIDGRAWRWEDGVGAEWARLRGDAALRLWGDVGAWRHLARVGLQSSVATLPARAPQPRAPDERLPPGYEVGPFVESRWLTADGAPLSARASLAYRDAAWRPDGTLRLRGGALWGELGAAPELQVARVGYQGGGMGGELGVIHVPEALLQVPARARVAVGEWSTGYSLVLDAQGQARLQSHGPTLAYDSPCACLEVRAGATWSVDQRLPTIGVQVDLR